MLTLHINTPYLLKNMPIKVGTYASGEYAEVEVHMDLAVPANLKRADLNHATAAEQTDFYDRVVQDWHGVADEHGQPIPCEGEYKAAVLKNDAVIMGVLQALTQIIMGVPLAKNSKAGSAL